MKITFDIPNRETRDEVVVAILNQARVFADQAKNGHPPVNLAMSFESHSRALADIAIQIDALWFSDDEA